METTITKLFKKEGRVVGALAYTRENGKFVHFKAKAVIMATGGWGRIFKVTSNSWEGTGDGVVLGYDAGAELVDMEMMQFHPTGMVWPPGVRGLLVTEGVRGEGGLLRNSEGERYMENYDAEKMELSTRDVVARANYTEVQEGRGSEHGGRLPRHHAPRVRRDHEEAPDHVRAVPQARRHRHLQGADGGLPDRPLHDGRDQDPPRDRRLQRARPLRRRRGRRRSARREPPRRQLTVRPARLRKAGRRGCRGVHRGERALGGDRRGRGAARDRARARAAGEARRRARALT